MALTAALLGWLFDGLEMGLFPLVARPALIELGVQADDVVAWNGVITALFLVGAATGGVLFGWLGDRIGRVRSMMLSVLTYALVSGACGFAWEPWQVGALRFLAALGMGGEWSLGVALINEIWPDRSRAFLAGLIGAAANVGYLVIGLVGRSLTSYIQELPDLLGGVGLSQETVQYLIGSQQSGWRILMMIGALPAILTFFIRIFVPESHRWEQERARGATSHWANRDLVAVLIGSVGACGIVAVWSPGWTFHWPIAVQILGTIVGLIVVTAGYTYPVIVYLQRSRAAPVTTPTAEPSSAIHAGMPKLGPSTGILSGSLPSATGAADEPWQAIIGRMLLAACLSGVALLGTWGTIQQAPTWAEQMTIDKVTKVSTLPTARSDTQIWAAIGAIVGTILAALLADFLGRRITYTLLCIGSLIIVPTLFLGCSPFDWYYLGVVFLAGAITASFYGWLPLYLPELFRTRIRATGQGFGFNFGRVIAAVGVLQLGNLKGLFSPYGWGDPQVYTMLSAIYVVGMVLIWLVPETKGQPLPE
jgi:MFS family permease